MSPRHPLRTLRLCGKSRWNHTRTAPGLLSACTCPFSFFVSLLSSRTSVQELIVGRLRSIVIVEGATLRESQKISQYSSTLGRWRNHMSHRWLSVPAKLIDEKTTPSRRSLQNLSLWLGGCRWERRGRRTLSDKQGHDWLVNHWGSLNG